MAKYVVRYWERVSIDKLVEAESEEEARQKMDSLVSLGGIDLSLEELDDSGIEVLRKAGKDDLEQFGEEVVK